MIVRRTGIPKFVFISAVVVGVFVAMHFGLPGFFVIGAAFWMRRGSRRDKRAMRMARAAAASLAPPPAPPIATPASTALLVAQLRQHATYVAQQIPGPAYALVRNIISTIESTLPALDREGADITGADAFTIRETAARYLPDTIQAFLRMPFPARMTQKLADGRTAHDHLIEQLTLLDERVGAAAATIARNDASALLDNGAFLRERFPTPFFKTS